MSATSMNRMVLLAFVAACGIPLVFAIQHFRREPPVDTKPHSPRRRSQSLHPMREIRNRQRSPPRKRKQTPWRQRWPDRRYRRTAATACRRSILPASSRRAKR